MALKPEAWIDVLKAALPYALALLGLFWGLYSNTIDLKIAKVEDKVAVLQQNSRELAEQNVMTQKTIAVIQDAMTKGREDRIRNEGKFESKLNEISRSQDDLLKSVSELKGQLSVQKAGP